MIKVLWTFCFNFFNYLFLAVQVFIAVLGSPRVAASRGYSLLRCAGFSLWWLLLLQSTGSRVHGLQ